MDYCTWFPEGWWSACCEAHDRNYADQIGQLIADGKLFLCVATSGDNVLEVAASVIVAAVMLAGVTLFGRRYYINANQKDKV